MSRIVTPGSLHSDDGGHDGRSRFFGTDLLSSYGLRAIFALLIAALLAFAPLTMLYWFNVLRFPALVSVEPGQRVVVKPGRQHRDWLNDEPGETVLLKVTCEVP